MDTPPRKPKRPRGHPPGPIKLTPERIKTIVTAIQMGATRIAAAQCATIGRDTLAAWLADGQKLAEKPGTDIDTSTDPLVILWRGVQLADGTRQRDLLAVIEKAARGGAKVHVETKTTIKPDGTRTEQRTEALQPPDWKAAAWKLEKGFPQEFGKQITEITGANGGAIKISTEADLSRLTDAELQTLADLAERIAGSNGDPHGAGAP